MYFIRQKHKAQNGKVQLTFSELAKARSRAQLKALGQEAPRVPLRLSKNGGVLSSSKVPAGVVVVCGKNLPHCFLI